MRIGRGRAAVTGYDLPLCHSAFERGKTGGRLEAGSQKTSFPRHADIRKDVPFSRQEGKRIALCGPSLPFPGLWRPFRLKKEFLTCAHSRFLISPLSPLERGRFRSGGFRRRLEQLHATDGNNGRVCAVPISRFIRRRAFRWAVVWALRPSVSATLPVLSSMKVASFAITRRELFWRSASRTVRCFGQTPLRALLSARGRAVGQRWQGLHGVGRICLLPGRGERRDALDLSPDDNERFLAKRTRPL